jgi:hypothetical protein
MGNVKAQNAARSREDLSRFVVHLTRDDRDTFAEGGKPARRNFLSIITERTVHPYQPHCLFNKKLLALPKSIRSSFKVSCFTEIPLDQIHLVTGLIKDRQVKLEPYGFVFRREFIIRNGGQPAIYINSYDGNMWLRKSMDDMFDASVKRADPLDPHWRLFPYVNAMHERCDFSWEREWRCRESLKFTRSDIVCLILPEAGEQDIKGESSKAGIAVVSPGWTYEQIVLELSRQQRATRRLHLEAEIAKNKKPKEDVPSV